jgi:hypothetical protein
MKVPRGTRHIFVEFCIRDGMPREWAEWEYDNALTINGYVRIRESYVTLFRAGAPFFMPRRERVSLYLTFENAMNHATFDYA